MRHLPIFSLRYMLSVILLTVGLQIQGMTLVSPTLSEEQPQTHRATERFLRGDLNNDGYRTVVDVMIIVDYILGDVHEDFDFDKANMNADDTISVVDAMILVDIILGSPYIDPENPNIPIDGGEGRDPGTGL